MDQGTPKRPVIQKLYGDNLPTTIFTNIVFARLFTAQKGRAQPTKVVRDCYTLTDAGTGTFIGLHFSNKFREHAFI